MHSTLVVDYITQAKCFYSSGNGLLMKSLAGVHLSTETMIPNVHMLCCASNMPFQSTHAQMDGKWLRKNLLSGSGIFRIWILRRACPLRMSDCSPRIHRRSVSSMLDVINACCNRWKGPPNLGSIELATPLYASLYDVMLKNCWVSCETFMLPMCGNGSFIMNFTDAWNAANKFCIQLMRWFEGK